MKPAAVMLLALTAPTLAGCAGFGFGGEASRGKPAAAAAPASAPRPVAPVGAVEVRPLPPWTPAAAVSMQPAAAIPPGGATPAQPGPAPALGVPSGAALGGVLGGPIGASLTEADRQAAWNAQIAALDSLQSRSWRGARGVFGFVAPGADTGGGCRAYSQTIYVAGRPNRGQGVACKQADGTWRMTS